MDGPNGSAGGPVYRARAPGGGPNDLLRVSFMSKGPERSKGSNRLALEASPYLQQHAHNPVDWYPWGPEALEKAKREDKPILLSIGYSACHWCHVMERESFEDAAIAATMNGWFVNVKVDREERPDLDHVYQLVVQLTGRSGGWPLTVFLTPDQKPFFGGTYFPPRDRYGMPGFPKVLESVHEAYRARRDEVDAHAGELELAIADAGKVGGGTVDVITPEFAASAARVLGSRFDATNGGFGHKPKFPNSTCLDVFLRVGDLAPARRALDAMRAGGIWDHLGGGFHRYSTDERWLVPHFEKMLYDNAQLLRTYADAWCSTREARYERTARDIAAYVAREMTAPDGGFYATQDADSEGEEGKFFVWTPAEVDAACGDDTEAAAIAKAFFDVTPPGNFEEGGASVLSTPASLEEVAARAAVPVVTAEAAIERARRRMFDARERRPKPFRDEKVLAGWNGLMAGALARAGAALDDAAMIEAASRALSCVECRLVVRESDGRARVLRHAKGDVVKGPGFLDDYAYVGDAALDLYEATGEPRWVTLARALADTVLARFLDSKEEGFFFTPDDGEKILVRTKDTFDHAVPSGSAIACRLLLRLGSLCDEAYAAPAVRSLEGLAQAAAQSPMGMSVTVGLVDRLARGSVDVVVVGPRSSAGAMALARAAQRTFVPNLVLAWADPTDRASMEACVALGRDKAAHAEPVAYVCRGRTCSPPVRDPRELERGLAER
jgi:uncharacterized protein YyaL (SSP411 family)